MNTLLVVLISVLSALFYLSVGSVMCGLLHRTLVHECTQPPRYGDLYGPHNDHFHLVLALVVGIFWPISWSYLLARKIALLPTADERSRALQADIERLERELRK